MADEPERRVVGAILAELERQREDGHRQTLYLTPVGPDGIMFIEGSIDLYLLARAAIKELKENPA